MEPTFGVLHSDELAEDARLRSQAFSVEVGPMDPDRPQVPLDRVHVARSADRLIGTATVFPFGQWFGGRSVPMGGLAGVAVAPEARGAGIARRLVSDAIRAMRARGEVISALYPTTATLYRSLGYEFAGRFERTTVDIRTVADAVGSGARSAALTTHKVIGTDVQRLRPLYDRLAAESSGWLDRSDVFWDRIAHDLNPQRHNNFGYVLADEDGEVRAGLTVSHRPGVEPLKFGLDVGGPFSDSPAAMRSALQLVAALGTTADRATLSLPVEQLALVLPAAYLDHADSWLWMLRLVDVGGAMTARGYNPAVTAEIQITVDDPVAPWNAGRWSVTVEGGVAAAHHISKDADDRSGAVSMDIQTLSGLYTGFLDPVQLVRAGRLPGADPGSVAALAAVFGGPAPRVVDFF